MSKTEKFLAILAAVGVLLALSVGHFDAAAWALSACLNASLLRRA